MIVVSHTIWLTVEAPGHEHFDNQENHDCCDVVLDWKDVMAMLVV